MQESTMKRTEVWAEAQRRQRMRKIKGEKFRMSTVRKGKYKEERGSKQTKVI